MSTVDWFAETLDIEKTKEFCESCGEGDGDWCDECNGCTYRNCNTCTCEKWFDVRVSYTVRVYASSEDDVDVDTISSAVDSDYPDDWEIYDQGRD